MAVTYIHADMLFGGLFLKSLLPFLWGAYVFSVDFKMKPPQTSVFLCSEKKNISCSVKFVERNNHVFSVYLMNGLV